MKKISALILILGVCLVSGFSLYFYSEKGGYSSSPLLMDPLGKPLVAVKIQGREYFLELNVSNRSALTLRKDILDCLEKELIDPVEMITVTGDRCENTAYRIKEVQVGKHLFQNVTVFETDFEKIRKMITYKEGSNLTDLEEIIFGWIGNGLLSQMNVLIDIPNAVMIECKNRAQLKKKGYNLDQWVKVPFKETRFGPVLSIGTDFGRARLALRTGGWESIIRSSFLEKNNPSSKEQTDDFISSHLIIGNKDFGKQSLLLMNLTPTFSEIDGALGLDFIAEHPIYIDRQEKAIYVKGLLPLE